MIAVYIIGGILIFGIGVYCGERYSINKGYYEKPRTSTKRRNLDCDGNSDCECSEDHSGDVYSFQQPSAPMYDDIIN